VNGNYCILVSGLRLPVLLDFASADPARTVFSSSHLSSVAALTVSSHLASRQRKVMRYFLVRDKASNGTSDNKNIQHTPFPRAYNNFFSFRFVGFLTTLVHYNGLDISCLVAVDMEVGRSFGEYIRVRLNDFCDLDGQASQVMFESHGRERANLSNGHRFSYNREST